MKNKRKFSVFLLMAALLLLVFCSCENDAVSYTAAEETAKQSESEAARVSEEGSSHDTDSNSEEQMTDITEQKQEPVQIQVYVCGAVKTPGVYTLPEGSRVYEAVAMAGGLLETADEKALNQARLLSDGEQVTVFTREEVENGADGSVSGGENGTGQDTVQKVNINTADANTLMTIPGIGESRAKAIIAYREENGTFASVEEIMKIDGIKEKMFEKIKDSITV